MPERDRDPSGRPRNARPRDALGRPLARGAAQSLPDAGLPADPALLLHVGTERFNAGRFFEAHEAWETAWHTAPAGERDFWQGITQVAVGFTHLQRGNPRGAVSLLRRGADHLDRYPSLYKQVDCAALARTARATAAAVEQSGANAAVSQPRISLRDEPSSEERA